MSTRPGFQMIQKMLLMINTKGNEKVDVNINCHYMEKYKRMFTNYTLYVDKEKQERMNATEVVKYLRGMMNNG